MLKKCLLAFLAFGTAFGAYAGSVFTDGETCGGCRMIVKNYPGPKGVAEFADGTRKTYCSTRCFACNMARIKADPIASAAVKRLWVQETSAINWKLPHAGKDNLIDARGAWYVYGSSKKATMGRSLAPFADKAEAQAFAREFGGTVHTFDELTTEFLGCKKRKTQPSSR